MTGIGQLLLHQCHCLIYDYALKDEYAALMTAVQPVMVDFPAPRR